MTRDIFRKPKEIVPLKEIEQELNKKEEELDKESVREVEITLTLLNAKLNYLISLLENLMLKVEE